MKNVTKIMPVATILFFLIFNCCAENNDSKKPNMIKNPSAEEVVMDETFQVDSKPANWNVYIGGLSGKLKWGTTSVSYEGKKGVFLEVPNPRIRKGKKDINIGLIPGNSNGYTAPAAYSAKSGAKYYFSFYIKGDISIIDVYITCWRTKEAKSKDRSHYLRLLTIRPTSKWTKYETTFELKKNTRKFVPVFYIRTRERAPSIPEIKTGQKVYIDKVYLCEIESKIKK
ncbi:MAG: hypothetical protein KAS17_00620 [Victivallaceae bacterium]|nr:hypothetical protein [Victivallaceae bacterium]